MKKNIEITGTLKMESQKNIVVDLFSDGGKIDWFDLDCDEESINTEISDTVGTILGVDINDYSDYMKLIVDLGLVVPSKWKKHWESKINENYFFVNSEDEICATNISSDFGYSDADIKRCRNHNMFPTIELAEKGKNISKLGRLILLWQYANDCIFETDWKDGDTKKYFIRYDYMKEEVCHDYNVTIPSDTLYFETSEQVKAFIEMYSEEIKKIMGVI